MPDAIDPKAITEKGDVEGQIKAVDRKVDYLLGIMFGLVMVLFVSFAALLVAVIQMELDQSRNKQTDYQRLTDQIQAQNTEINAFQKQLSH